MLSIQLLAMYEEKLKKLIFMISMKRKNISHELSQTLPLKLT